MIIKTARFGIKDKNKGKILDQMARDVNFTWNVLNAASRKKWKESRKYFHKFDPFFNAIINGASRHLSIPSETLQAVRDQFHCDIRKQKKQLRFRGEKSRKWVPFKKDAARIRDGVLFYKKTKFRFWKSASINGVIKSGSFVQDNTGRWFINISYECNDIKKSKGTDCVGIDLGLKTTATCSNGKSLDVNDLKEIDKRVARLQRARRFKLAKALQKKKANIKNDRFNKFALDLVNTNNLVAIGNVQGFTTGKMAKSRYANSWSLLKNKIKFKCLEYGVRYLEVSEYLTTQTCNTCGSVEGPKGIKELGVRFWKCSCGAELSRDDNASKNILNRARVLAS
jgi:transposase